ncbi:hypothetical protein ACJJTC_005434 [Scirpophaga incertulas]
MECESNDYSNFRQRGAERSSGEADASGGTFVNTTPPSSTAEIKLTSVSPTSARLIALRSILRITMQLGDQQRRFRSLELIVRATMTSDRSAQARITSNEPRPEWFEAFTVIIKKLSSCLGVRSGWFCPLLIIGLVFSYLKIKSEVRRDNGYIQTSGG